MRCISIARGTGDRCKNDAAPGTPFCDVSQHNARGKVAPDCDDVLASFLEAQTAPATPARDAPLDGPGPEDSTPARDAPLDGSRPDPSEAARAEFTKPGGVGDPGESAPSGPGAELPRAPSPEDEQAAGRPEPERDLDGLASRIPPHIFKAAERDGPGPDSSREPEDAGRGRQDGGGAPISMDAPITPPHSPGQIRRIVMPAVDRGFVAVGWAPLEDAEAQSGAEIISAWLNRTFERLDLTDPLHQLVVWVVVVVGSRAAPQVVGKAAGVARARMGLSQPEPAEPPDAENGTRPEPEERRRPAAADDDGEGWGPLGVMT